MYLSIDMWYKKVQVILGLIKRETHLIACFKAHIIEYDCINNSKKVFCAIRSLFLYSLTFM